MEALSGGINAWDTRLGDMMRSWPAGVVLSPGVLSAGSISTLLPMQRGSFNLTERDRVDLKNPLLGQEPKGCSTVPRQALASYAHIILCLGIKPEPGSQERDQSYVLKHFGSEPNCNKTVFV